MNQGKRGEPRTQRRFANASSGAHMIGDNAPVFDKTESKDLLNPQSELSVIDVAYTSIFVHVTLII